MKQPRFRFDRLEERIVPSVIALEVSPTAAALAAGGVLLAGGLYWAAQEEERPRRKKPAWRVRLALEGFEDRIVPAVFNVNSTLDILSPPPGIVTLRSAIQAANATPGNNTINLTVGGTYKITLVGTPGETDNQAGEFAIIPNAASPPGSTLTIVNTSGHKVTVDGNNLNRVFDINPNPLFTATLSGAQQVPPTASPGTGTASIQFSPDQGTITVNVSSTGLLGAIAAQHLHVGAAGTNGPLAQDANGNNIELGTANPATGTFTVNNNNGFLTQLFGGGIYTNIHTTAFPGGEIRGQFSSTPKFTVVMQGFTIDNGIASPGDASGGSGGGIRDQGNVSLTLTNMVVTNNTATADGGGVAMENLVNTPWTLTVNNSTISNNHAGDAGGGIETDGSGKVFVNSGSKITGNTCVNQGAGIWLDAVADANNVLQSANLTVTKAVVSHNRALVALNGGAPNVGGGIGNAGTGAVSIDKSTISDNFEAGNGGGFGDENNLGTLSVTDSIFCDNFAGLAGGGIAEGDPSATISDSTFEENVAGTGGGGGVFTNGTTLNIHRTTINDNRAGGDGGGVDSDGAAVTITNSTLANDFAGGSGGGYADLTTTGTLALWNSIVRLDSAGGNGGGVATSGPTTTITNSAIHQNTAGGNGGGVFANGGTLTVQSSTIDGNTASGNGGGIELETTGTGFLNASTIINATIAGNRALNNAGANGGGVDLSAAFTGDVKFINDTINGNFASTGGGLYWTGTGNIAVGNTIIAGNFATVAPDVSTNQLFTATLNGAQQVPPVPTPGTGTASILFNPDLSTISVNISSTGLLGAITAQHLHVGAAGTNGPVAQDANGNNIELGTANPATGTFTVDNSTAHNPGGFISQLQAGNIYTNIHTSLFPNGEIRGQFSQVAGTFTDLGGNLIGVAGPGSGNNVFTVSTLKGTVGSPLDPKLGPLQNNGGPRIGSPGHSQILNTELLQTGSPAIGQGVLTIAPPVDERGFQSLRHGAVNIGATSSNWH
jgi:hypothetical protein